jgi:hypothetical protein
VRSAEHQSAREAPASAAGTMPPSTAHDAAVREIARAAADTSGSGQAHINAAENTFGADRASDLDEVSELPPRHEGDIGRAHHRTFSSASARTISERAHLAVASSGAASSASITSHIFDPTLSEEQVQQRIREEIGGMGPQLDLVSLSQAYTKLERTIQEVRVLSPQRHTVVFYWHIDAWSAGVPDRLSMCLSRSAWLRSGLDRNHAVHAGHAPNVCRRAS